MVFESTGKYPFSYSNNSPPNYHCSAVFRSHVGNRGSVSQSESGNTRTIELNELADNSSFPEHLSDSEDKISGSAVIRQLAI